MSKAIQAKIDANEKERIKLEIQLRKFNANQKFKCPDCQVRSKAKDFLRIVDYCYVEPYSCSSGDYWTHNDIMKFVCPSCNVTMRILSEKNKERFKSFLGISEYVVTCYPEKYHKEWYEYHNNKEKITEIGPFKLNELKKWINI